ncbi:ABC transporter permease [bacterium]|nr:ABC transporter permease [bacterium]
MTLSLRMPRRFLRGGYGRLLLTILALACGVALVCALDLVNRAVLRGFVEIIDGMAGRATLQVAVEDAGAFPEALADEVAAVDGVAQVLAVVSATAFTVTDPPEALTVQAFDVTDPAAVRVYQPGDAPGAIVDDPLGFLNQRDSIIVTRDFARRHGLAIEDRLPLDTARGRRTFTVRGLVDPQGIGRAFGGTLVLMDVQAAEAVFTSPGLVNRLDIVTDAAADTAAVARRVQAMLPDGLRVEAVAQRKADLRAVLRSMQVLLRGVSLVALGAAFIIAFSRLSMCFAERTWQLGVLRAVGMRRRAVCWELLKESQLLGLAGVALGLPAGVAMGRALLPLVATTMALNFRTVAPPSELAVRPAALAIAAALGLGAALAAALPPAWRAASVDVAETLRGRGADLAPARRESLAGIAALALIALAAVIAQGVLAAPAAGLVASAALVLLTGALARPLVRRFDRLAARASLPGMGAVGRLALRLLRHDLRRAALAVAMVGIGVGTVVWLALVAYSFERTAVRVFEQAMRADYVVSSSHTGAGALEMPVDEGLAATLAGVDGVAAVIGVRLANWQHQGEPIVLDAFDPAYFRNPAYGRWPLHGARLDDAWEAVAAGRAVVVSSNFAQNMRVGVGDTVTLTTPRGPLPLLVAGITTDFASPRGTIEMSRALYREHWNDGRVTRFFVQGGEPADPALRGRLQQRLAALGGAWRVISSGELVAYWEQQIRRAFASLYALAVVILGVVLFGITDNLGASVVERTRQLGTLRAAGVRQGQLRRLVVNEALVIVGLGLLLAAAEGAGMALLWVRTTVPLLLGWIVDLHVPVAFLAIVALSTAASGALAALLPARRAARLEPAAALRWE